MFYFFIPIIQCIFEYNLKPKNKNIMKNSITIAGEYEGNLDIIEIERGDLIEAYENSNSAEEFVTKITFYTTDQTSELSKDDQIQLTDWYNEFSEKCNMSNDEKLNNIINQFPNDATSWKDATDEIRDLCREVRTTYNELVLDVLEDEPEAIKALNFRMFSTPAKWNSEAKNQILHLWVLMPESIKETIINNNIHLIK